MNTSQRIYFSTGDTGNSGLDKYVKVRLEQNVRTLEVMTLNLSTEDVYRNYNSNYGVLVGRVLANGGIGVPNAKISIFIPLSDDDANNSDIYSIYPYKTPRDKNNEGKRYNLLPRVSQYEASTGTNKPKQPFGSFPIKSELITNEPILNVYKKYYKYTALTNQYGDYMIFGVPTGTQTAHLSVDITDIGKYSMTPASMINAGYPANLFTNNSTAIKPSNDLGDLPNIETQEISVEIYPFWGDVENFEIGITRQDFRIRATISSDFVVFGTTMTMGLYGIFGNPAARSDNWGFYSLDTDDGGTGGAVNNNMDIRTYRSVPPIIKVFTYTNDIPINPDDDTTLNLPVNIDFNNQIRELDKSEYFEYNVNGNFLLNIPCNRRKVIVDDNDKEIVVDDSTSYGVFTRFYGMILIEYPSLNELPQNSGWSHKYNGPNPQNKARGRLKIPQSLGLMYEGNNNEDAAAITNNNNWRNEYFSFSGGGIYSVAQFYPTKVAYGSVESVATQPNTENVFISSSEERTAGAWFKVAGEDFVTQNEDFDSGNYISTPTTGDTTTSTYVYDFSPNVESFSASPNNRFFGGQWLNFCLTFPQYGWAYDAKHENQHPDRKNNVADVFHNNYNLKYFMANNDMPIFANLKNTVGYLKGDAFSTTFINMPRTEIGKLLQIPLKGINARRINNDTDSNYHYTGEALITSSYKYLPVKHSGAPSTNGREYLKYGWDDYHSDYTDIPSGDPISAYLFKGMYDNDCIQMLYDLNIV